MKLSLNMSKVESRKSTAKKAGVRPSSAFTMVEIAISLAVIGIALVAILGVLPLGMQVQRDNREQTVINQDSTVFIESIRNSARGLDDLTNYVYAITNYWTKYQNGAPGPSQINGYNYSDVPSDSSGGGYFTSVYNRLDRGSNIVGLLSTPEYIDANGLPLPGIITNLTCYSNHIIVYVRSVSGPAVEKPPQTNSLLQSSAFRYEIFCVNAPADLSVPGFWDGSQNYPAGANVSYTNFVNGQFIMTYWSARTNTFPVDKPGLSPLWIHNGYLESMLQNMHELRMTFLWPVQPNGKLGLGRWTYRTTVAGKLGPEGNLFFYQSQFFDTNSFAAP